MDWNKGYSASYYMMEIDPITWQDRDRIEIKSGSIKRKAEGLRQSADVNCKNYPVNTEKWVRIYLDAKQSGAGAHVPLFTGLAISPDRNMKGTWTENNVQCYSVLKPADDVVLTRGWYATTDQSCASLLEQLLVPVPAPKVFEDSVTTLQNTIVAEAGETNLTMAERIISAMNWNLRIDGDGTMHFGEYPTESSIVFDPFDFDVIENEINISADWYSCPNVFMVSNNYGSAIAKDEDENSPLSIQNRGREVWMYETGGALSKNETLEEYTRRRLKEEQQYLITASYNRRFVPNLLPGDLITAHYPKQGLDGDFIITSQSITLGFGARTAEEIAGITA